MKTQFLEMSLMFCSAVVRLDFHCHHDSLNLSLRKENWGAWSHRCLEHLAEKNSHWCQQHTSCQNVSGEVVAAGNPAAAP